MGAAPQWRVCRDVFGVAALRRPHGGVVGAGGLRLRASVFARRCGGRAKAWSG